jgi:hypothetical protein
VRTRFVNPDSAAGACVWYAVLACAMTWPVVLHLSTGIPENLGDPLLNIWILGWDASHLLRFLSGHLGALSGFWNANIFYPEPLTLAYSEHLLAQAIQILPVYALGGNLILCYNLLFLSTFVLSGLGVFLLVRELTGNGRAAFLAGLLYGFALFRAAHFGQVQVLSSQWMPFVLFGLRRYFVTRRWTTLAGAAAALIAQNLSCGYYLIFFAPFAAAYVMYEIASRRLFRDVRLLASLLLAGAVVALATAPFLAPYQALHAQGLLLRDPGDVDQFSADVYGYLSASPAMLVWGRLHMIWKGENALFFGAVPLGLGVLGVAVAGWRAWRAVTDRVPDVPRDRSLTYASSAVAILAAAMGVAILFAGRRVFPLKMIDPELGMVPNYFAASLLGLVGVLVSTPRVRALFRGGSHHSSAGFYAIATAAAVWLSFGRVVRSLGYAVSHETVYGWLYRHVPGFDGLRCPARCAMLAALFMAVLGGFGADWIVRRWRFGRIIVLVLGTAFFIEASRPQVPVTAVWAGTDAGLPSALGAGAQRLYRYVDALPADAVLAEFPFSDEAGVNTAYMYGSTQHWRRLVNGHSGVWPASYLRRRNDLAHPLDNPDHAWRTLVASGATYAIVHEGLYNTGEGPAVTQWLRRSGAREILRSGSERLFAISGMR